MDRLPTPRIAQLTLDQIEIDEDLNPRDPESYRVEDMVDALNTSGALNDSLTVHQNGKAESKLLCGHRQYSALIQMRGDAEDKKAWDKQWQPITCEVYENLSQEQIEFVVNDHGSNLSLNKAGVYRAFKQALTGGSSISEFVNRNWNEIASACKTPTATEEARKRIDKETTESGRRSVRVATVKQHSDMMAFCYRVVEAGSTTLEDEYLKHCRGVPTLIKVGKKAFSELANLAEEDVECGRKPMGKGASYKRNWLQLVKEKKEADEAKESDESVKPLKPATKEELAAAKRRCTTELGRMCMDYANGDKTMLKAILEMEPNVVNLSEVREVIEATWPELRKEEDPAKAASKIVGTVFASVGEKRKEEESE
jgi:hypothetical protein